MIKVYKPILFTCGVFVLGLLMHCLRQGGTLHMKQVLPLLLLYAIGAMLALLAKPIIE